MPGQGRRKRHESDADSEKKETVSADVYISQAITFQAGQQWQKSVDSYTKALELKHGDLNCLVSRSKCYLELGDGKKALADADETLTLKKDYVKGLLQKAEALYLTSDFEMALVFYHRGNKLRPEVNGFRLGIQKCQEAIDNSIGDAAGIKLEKKGDLEYFYEGQQQQQPTKQKSKAGGYSKPGAKKDDDKKQKKQRKKTDPKTAKQLLGELYADKEYLENLLEEMEKAERQTKALDDCKAVAEECLEYLDSRTEFWQQQKPMYSRKRDKQIRDKTGSRSGSAKGSPMQWVVKQLEEIDEAQEEERYEDSLRQCKRVLKKLENWSNEDIADREEALANLHSQMGNAYLEIGQYDKALHHHKQDKEIATEHDLKDAKSRSLDNLGRVYARMGKYDKAIEVWEEKLPYSTTPLETTWLNHEIGRCYLEKGKYEKAKEYGEKSMAAAQESGDKVWQLNASVLISQSLVKMGDYQQGLEQFETSLDLARAQDDEAAETAIKKAMEDVNNKIVKGLKEDGEQSEEDEKEEGELVDYSIKVWTGDKWGAGTDAHVFIQLFGEDGQTREIKLRDSKTHEHKFEKGDMDEFSEQACNVKKLSKIRIGHDGAKAAAGWYLDKVVITQTDPAAETEFNCDKWLDVDEGDGAIVRELFPMTNTAQDATQGREPESDSPNEPSQSQDTEDDTQHATVAVESETDQGDGQEKK